jgi:N-acetylneuraminic acid mutarotase
VSAGDYRATTDATGAYDIHLPVGTYDVTVSAYGYATKVTPGVAVAENAQVTEDFSLAAVPKATVSGVVTDGSGHGWPLYAKITVDGVPGGPVFTDPGSGHYSLSLPQDQTYTLHITPAYGGYESVSKTVTVGATVPATNVEVPVDSQSCTAAGYKLNLHGQSQPFDETAAPAGWTVADNGGVGGWQFTDDGNRTNKTGGTGGFAMVDSDHLGAGNSQDTTLTSPAFEVSSGDNPTVSFDTDYDATSSSTATVEVSADGGTTWSTVWQRGGTSLRGPAHIDLPMPRATATSPIQARFHYTGAWAWWWELDNVFVGSHTCDVVPGGLVYGQVTDANTGAALSGAVVSTPDATAVSATSAATPEDPNLGDGFYSLFSPVTGDHPFNGAKAKYTTATRTVKVAADYIVAADFALAAGRVTVTPAAVDKTVAWGGTATASLTLKNTGGAAATVKIAERSGGSQPLAEGGAPVNRVTGKFSNRSARATAHTAAPPAQVAPSDAPWTSIADYPSTIQDNAAAYYDGKIYSAFGYDGEGDTAATYVFDPDTGSWSALASGADAREAAAGAFIGDKFYVSGGWGPTGGPDGKTEVYHPAGNTWSTGATNPKPHAGTGKAVLDDKLYLIGGCSADSCGSTDVQVYDPATDTWSTGAPYPESISWQSCGTLDGSIYCAGGSTDSATVTHSYVYDPGTQSWSAKADLPIDLWGSTYAAANGKLLVSGGVTGGSTAVTNQGYAYDPAADSWTALPNANQTRYRSGSACGLYRIGGNPGGFLVPPVATSEVLPGFTECSDSTDVSWLSESATTVTLQPGASFKVTVSLNAGVAEITQPGTYTASVALSTDTPYRLAAVPVTMTVNPPKTWGKITGKVTSAVDGSGIGGATLQIDSWATSYTLKTAADGTYALWLDTRNNPLQLIAAKDGYQPQTRAVKINRTTPTTADFALKKS